MSKFSVEQRPGVEHDRTRIPDKRAIVQNLQELVPADVRAVSGADLFAFGGDVRVQRLPGVVKSELFRHDCGSRLKVRP
jgi:hypothetical protein